MVWAQWRDDGTIFHVRVAGVAIAGGRVLLHRMQGEEHWSLPGGRLQVGETARDALRREMQEEISTDVDVGGLLWLIENFFDHRPMDGRGEEAVVSHHEVGLYLAMGVPERLRATERFTGVELAGTPEEFVLEFRWFPQAELSSLDVRPATLRERLAGELPAGVPSVVVRG